MAQARARTASQIETIALRPRTMGATCRRATVVCGTMGHQGTAAGPTVAADMDQLVLK